MNRPLKSDAGRLDGCRNPQKRPQTGGVKNSCPHTTAYEKSGHCRIEETEEDRTTRGDESEEDTERIQEKEVIPGLTNG